MKRDLLTDIKGRFYLDGAMGSALVSRGFITKNPELLNVTHPDVIQDILEGYFKAGSNAVSANTFGCNSIKADLSKYSLKEIIECAYKISREVADKNGGYLFYDCGPSGEMLYPYGKTTFEGAYEIFAEQAKIVNNLNFDAVIIETFTDLQELRTAVLAFKEHTDLPILCSMSFGKNGRTFSGVSVESFALTAQSLGVQAVGINCGTGAVEMINNACRLVKASALPTYVKPNAGIPRYSNGTTVYDVEPAEFAKSMVDMAKIGIEILGGCCGTDDRFIREMVNATKDICIKREFSAPSAVCSYSTVVEFGKEVLVIGERVNPTNKPLLKRAILEDDYDYILSMCMEQIENGANMLDVNLGMSGIDENEKLSKAIVRIQGVADVPLVIDTPKKQALENAVRLYNGVAVINSVNGETTSMNTVFPIAKKYGSYVIALCLDENGIPDSVEGRIEIAKRIIKKAKEYGIEKEKLIFDPLTLAVSVNINNALTTLSALERLNDELSVKTTLGLSNISFGLPNRQKINACFYDMAIKAGVKSVIINPTLKPMHDCLAFNMLMGKDVDCNEYVKDNSIIEGQKTNKEVETVGKDVAYFITHGLKEEGLSAIKHIVNVNNYNDVLENKIIDGLNQLGKQYEQGKAFLPQLIAGSEVAKGMLEYIKSEFFNVNDDVTKATILLATVKGDVHDIGKNIVKAVVSNYGYRCVDLGRDVSTQEIIDAVDKYQPQAVGLSALMTTTLDSMSESVKALKKRNAELKIFVGGAVVTDDYAKEIGAIYGKDALSTVKKLEQLYNNC